MPLPGPGLEVPMHSLTDGHGNLQTTQGEQQAQQSSPECSSHACAPVLSTFSGLIPFGRAGLKHGLLGMKGACCEPPICQLGLGL